MIFAYPQMFWLLLLLPLLALWQGYRRRGGEPTLQVSSTLPFVGLSSGLRAYLRPLPLVLRLLAMALLVVALARPQTRDDWTDITTEGIDIVLAMDISSSMLARDFQPNRLEVAKEMAARFIINRPNDRVGLVVFSGESFTQSPLTTDHPVVINQLSELQSGMLEDGTAIGMGLATSVSRLKDSQAISKVVVLLTDGVNNKGTIAPLTAAEIAQTLGVRVYTIGVGSYGKALFPVQTAFGTQYQQMDVTIDEEMLGQISQMTGGKYFRADSEEALRSIYDQIDQLEKSKIEEQQQSRRTEEFWPFVAWASLLVLLELVLRHTLLRTIP